MSQEPSHGQAQLLALVQVRPAQLRRARDPLPTAAGHLARADVPVGTFTNVEQRNLAHRQTLQREPAPTARTDAGAVRGGDRASGRPADRPPEQGMIRWWVQHQQSCVPTDFI